MFDSSRKLSRESPGQTLQATALVDHAGLRLVVDESQNWQSRGHFLLELWGRLTQFGNQRRLMDSG